MHRPPGHRCRAQASVGHGAIRTNCRLARRSTSTTRSWADRGRHQIAKRGEEREQDETSYSPTPSSEHRTARSAASLTTSAAAVEKPSANHVTLNLAFSSNYVFDTAALTTILRSGPNELSGHIRA